MNHLSAYHHLFEMRRFLKKLRDYLRWQFRRLSALPGFLINYVFGRMWNDVWLSTKKRIFQGGQSLGNRCAVYVIFPKDGLCRSHQDSLAYLVQQGLAPCVVSNLPLDDAERDLILPLCWRLIERPNFGYDFGAYREGVLTVTSAQSSLEEIFLFNDSVWFPMPHGKNWIDQARRMNLDFVGAVSNGGMEDFLSERSRVKPRFFDPSASGLHYCSFALRIGSKVLQNPSFKRFWTSFKLTNNKRLTIARGELGLSRWIIDSGYSHLSTLDLSGFEGLLERLEAKELLEFAEHLVIPESAELRAEQASWIAKPKNSVNRDDLIRFILWAVADSGPAYALAHWALGSAGHDFLKKSPLWLSGPSADVTMRVIKDFGTEVMRSESAQIRSKSFRNL